MATTVRTSATHKTLYWVVVRHRLRRALLYAFLVAGCVATLLPFLWMVFGSFKSYAEIIRVPPTLWPEEPTLENYYPFFTDPKLPLGRFYLNSILVSVSIVTLTLFTSSLAGFVFAKYQFSGQNVLFGFVLSTIMIPFQLLMIPTYLLLARLGLLDSLWGLIVPTAVDAFGIFLMKQFIEGLPNDLLDAARIDGASEWGIYWRIILPQIGPALSTLGILTFMWSWNNYLWPLIVITTNERRTLPIMLTWYNVPGITQYNLTMASGMLVVVPLLVVYVVFQRWIVQGFALSGLK